MVDMDNIGLPPNNGPYLSFGILTCPIYTSGLAHLTMPEVVNLTKKHMHVGRAPRAIYGAIENPGGAPLSAGTLGAFADITNGSPSFMQLTDAEAMEAWALGGFVRPCTHVVILHMGNGAPQTL